MRNELDIRLLKTKRYMEEIRKFVDEMMVWAGVSGDSVPVLRHLLLTVTAILLAIISDFLCRKILVPLISKITEKTEASWDDVPFYGG